MFWVALVILAIVIVFVTLSVKIIPQQQVGVLERLGKYQRLLMPGVNLVIPVIDRLRVVHDLRIQQTIVPTQSVITKDNVQVQIDTIIFYQVVSPEHATYGILDYVSGVRNITTATMRQIIGKMELDETLSGREKISTEIRVALDEATEKWGVRIERVEIMDIKPPADIQEAMDKQMKAERNKRAIILEAEAARQDMILAIAEAEKRRIEMLREAGLDERVLAYRSFEALIDIAKGDSNKVFLPVSAVEALGSIGAIGEVFKEKDKKPNG